MHSGPDRARADGRRPRLVLGESAALGLLDRMADSPAGLDQRPGQRKGTRLTGLEIFRTGTCHGLGPGSVSASGRRDESRRRATRVVPVTTRPIATTFAAW